MARKRSSNLSAAILAEVKASQRLPGSRVAAPSFKRWETPGQRALRIATDQGIAAAKQDVEKTRQAFSTEKAKARPSMSQLLAAYGDLKFWAGEEVGVNALLESFYKGPKARKLALRESVQDLAVEANNLAKTIGSTIISTCSK